MVDYRTVVVPEPDLELALSRAPPWPAIVTGGKYKLPEYIVDKMCFAEQEDLNLVKVVDGSIGMVLLDTPDALGRCMLFEKPGMWARADAAAMLGYTALVLHKKFPDLTLWVRDAFRSLVEQKIEFDRMYNKLQQLHPLLPAEEIYPMATHLVADPSGGLHTGGGAFDLALVDKKGAELYTGFCRQTAEMPEFQGVFPDNRNSLYSAGVNERAFLNRSILAWATTTAGLYNDGDEEWHKNANNRAVAHKNKTNCLYPDLNSYQEAENIEVAYSGPVFEKDLPENIFPILFLLDFCKDRKTTVDKLAETPAVFPHQVGEQCSCIGC